jgi:hypothetical protein
MRPSRFEFDEMMRHSETYSGTGIGAEQEFLADLPDAKEDSLYWTMVTNHDQEVANWNFSAEPKRMWRQSLHKTVWPNIVFMVSEDIRHRGHAVRRTRRWSPRSRGRRSHFCSSPSKMEAPVQKKNSVCWLRGRSPWRRLENLAALVLHCREATSFEALLVVRAGTCRHC